MLAALLHFIKVFNYVVTFFSSEAIECSYVDNKGLVPSVIMHTFKASPHLKGSLALVHMDHLSIGEVALYLHVMKASLEPQLHQP